MRRLVMTLIGASVATSALADTAQDANQTASQPQSVWQVRDDGAAAHLQSGLVCQPRLGPFQRTSVQVFDQQGLDIGCNYSNGAAAITVYLTRRDQGDLDAAMAEAKRELLDYGAARHPQLIADDHLDRGGVTWSAARYAEDGDLRSTIWIGDLSDWTFEYRVTAPLAQADEVDAQVAALTDQVQATAGAHLRLCAKSPPPARTGAQITDQDALQKAAMMSSLLGGGAMAAAQDKGAPALPAAPPPQWCVEQGFKVQDVPMLFWRGVDEAGADARADRMSLLTMGPPPSLEIAPEPPLVGLVEGSVRWRATVRRPDGGVLIFAYFDSRPSAQTVADLFARIAHGQAKPIGGYSLQGKTLIINTPAGK